jgi:D-tyrosyl-tRNA(Tyr) deacylase
VRAVVQRVRSARVTVAAETVGECGPGLCILLGVAGDDGERDADRLAGRIARLRIFDDAAGRFDASVTDTGGEALVVSQFTLLADTSKGNRPSFSPAAPPARAEPLYERFCRALADAGVARVATGRFGARMLVEIANDGPVTLVIET